MTNVYIGRELLNLYISKNKKSVYRSIKQNPTIPYKSTKGIYKPVIKYYIQRISMKKDALEKPQKHPFLLYDKVILLHIVNDLHQFLAQCVSSLHSVSLTVNTNYRLCV